jgi:hypothetical protein
VVDFGAHRLNPDDDYPDFVIPPFAGAGRSHGCGASVCLELGSRDSNLKHSSTYQGSTLF